METNQIYCGDNIKVMSDFPDVCIDLTVTSPPYDNLRTYNGYTFDFENVAKQLYRVTKHGGVVVWVVGDATTNGSETGTSFKQALYFKEIGFNLHDTMIFYKEGFPTDPRQRYYQRFEYMFVLSKGKPKTYNPLLVKTKAHGRKFAARDSTVNGCTSNHNITKTINKFTVRGNVWKYDVRQKPDFKHPAVFPEQLVADHIISWSNEVDLVLDPFSGSGTTAKMAKVLERQYIGIDISQEYCDIAKRRLQEIL